MHVRCVGAVVRDVRGRLLMIERAHPPGAGLWSLPGGRVEPGETDAEAVLRELREETGLCVRVGAELGVVRRAGPGDVVFVIHDYLAEPAGGELIAGDDANDVRWVSPAGLPDLPHVPGLVEALRAWNVLDRPS